VAAALLLLVASCFAMYYGIYHLGLVLDNPSSSILEKDTFLFLFAAPLLALGGWWIYPSSARWILAAYGLLALLFAYFSVVFLFVPFFFPHDPDNNFAGVGHVLVGSVFGLSTALFAAVGCVLAFSPSVRDFGNYRRALQKRQEEKG